MHSLISAVLDALMQRHPSVLLAVAAVATVGWTIKQYQSLPDNRTLLQNRHFRASVLVILVSLSAYHVIDFVQRRPPAMPLTEGKIRVVVLPFENLTDHDSLGSAMALSLTDSFLNSDRIIAYNETGST